MLHVAWLSPDCSTLDLSPVTADDYAEDAETYHFHLMVRSLKQHPLRSPKVNQPLKSKCNNMVFYKWFSIIYK